MLTPTLPNISHTLQSLRTPQFALPVRLPPTKRIDTEIGITRIAYKNLKLVIKEPFADFAQSKGKEEKYRNKKE